MSGEPLSTRELAESLGVSVRTVEGWRYSGGGPAFHYIGGRAKYFPADIKRWLGRQRRSA